MSSYYEVNFDTRRRTLTDADGEWRKEAYADVKCR